MASAENYCNMAQVYDNDSWKDTARVIWDQFDINQSCIIRGNVVLKEMEEIIPKGELVISELRRLDILENMKPVGNKMTRRRNTLKDSIGGYVSQKIFRYKQETRDGKIIFTIWRVQ